MATKTRKRQAKSTSKAAKATAKTAQKANVNGDGRKRHDDEKLTKAIVAARKKGEKWDPIAEQLGCTPGKAQQLMMIYEVEQDPSLKITGKTDADLGKKIVRARDKDGLSFGQLVARTGFAQSRVRSLYAEASGGDHRGKRARRGGGLVEPNGSKAKSAKSGKGKSASKAKSSKTRKRTKAADPS